MKPRRLLLLALIAIVLIFLVSLPWLIPYTIQLIQPSEQDIQYQFWSAVGSHNTGRMEELVERNPQLLKERGEAGSLLHMAAGDGNVEFAEFLLKHGLDPNLRDPEHGMRPLHLCTGRCEPIYPEQTKIRFLETTRLLIKHGANVNAKNDWISVLGGATGSDVRIIQLLVENGADLTELYDLGEGKKGNAYDLAVHFKNKAGADYLAPLKKPKTQSPGNSDSGNNGSGGTPDAGKGAKSESP